MRFNIGFLLLFMVLGLAFSPLTITRAYADSECGEDGEPACATVAGVTTANATQLPPAMAQSKSSASSGKALSLSSRSKGQASANVRRSSKRFTTDKYKSKRLRQ